MDVFHHLGLRIAQTWRKHKFELAAFPNIAATELARQPLHQVIDYSSIVSSLATIDALPYQTNIDSVFGEPPLTLFWHPSFYIEALFWVSSTTSIHGHGFVGGFQVLAGTSLQSLFTFDANEPRRGRCRIGRLSQTHAILLRTGATQMIEGGERFIHSVFHLGYPSVTIVVRTHGDAGPQFDYHRPGVALAFQYEKTFDQLTRRLLQIARLQAILNSDDLQATVAAIAKQGDLAACFRLLEIVQPILYANNKLSVAGEVIATLVAAIGLNKATALAEALTLEHSLGRLRRAREIVVEEDLRLFLALLLTQQERRFLMPLASAYAGVADPTDKIVHWIIELSRKGILRLTADDDLRRLVSLCLAHRTDDVPASIDANFNHRDVARARELMHDEPLVAPLLRSDATEFGRCVNMM